MTYIEALKWCIDNPGELVRDNAGQWHQVCIDSGAPRLRSDMKARAFDPDGEPYRESRASLVFTTLFETGS